MNYQEFINTALSKASVIASQNFGSLHQISTKANDNNQVLTKTDIEIGTLLIKEISRVFPDHNIIDEEAGVIDNGSDFTWVVDPIDGTSNFAEGIPLYGILLGLIEGSIPIAGGMALPGFQKIYSAEKSKGAFCNGNMVHVSNKESLLNSLVAYGIDGHREDPKMTSDECAMLSKIILNIRNLRSSNSAYDSAMVLEGKYGASLNQTSKIWDNVASNVLIEEAGGIYTDFFGKPINYSNPFSKADVNFTYCTGNAALHKQLQEIINS